MDQGLVIRAADGDEVAFRELVELSSGRLLAMARLILHDTGAAEDAIQDAFVDAWRGLHRLRDPERFDAWMRRLAVNACFDYARRRRRDTVREIPLPPDLSVAVDPDGSIVLRDELQRALERLTPEQRAVLVVTYYLDLPIVEAADALAIPVGTLKSRLDRARHALRSAMDAEGRAVSVMQERYA
jgi:RNA polymerase sigma-70 factor (ECF subfamily)